MFRVGFVFFIAHLNISDLQYTCNKSYVYIYMSILSVLQVRKRYDYENHQKGERMRV